MKPLSPLHQVLDLARWAPSGDNTQPWRFEIVGERRLVVHGFDTRDHCVYDLDGHASQISLGALLQTMEIAASLQAWRMSFQRRPRLPDKTPTFDVAFELDPNIAAHPLAAVIERRSVQRRALRTRPLTAEEKLALERAAGSGHELIWIEGARARLRAAMLMFRNAKLRLTMPEAYEVHRCIIDWGQRYSEDKVPDQALGADRLTLQLMRVLMQSWERIEFMNRWLAGTLAPRLQMDLVPSLACAAHFAISARKPPSGIDDWVMAGQALQRIWLTATSLGLQSQPEMTPVIFSRYVATETSFTRVASIQVDARRLRDDLAALLGSNLDQVVWMARIGDGPAPRSRSLRMPLARLIIGRTST
jgi:nitroreductase